MDAHINIKVEAEQLNPSENLIQREQDWQECFSENSEATHSSSNNLNKEGLKLHIKQEQQTVPIKEEELVILSEINYYNPQDKPLDQNALNSFLWPSYLKKEIEESVETQEKSGEKSQSIKTLQSKNPIVLLEDFRHSHKKILEQSQSEDYRKKLRPREKSESVPYSSRKRSRQSNITFTDKSSDKEHSKKSGKHKNQDSGLEDELVDVTEDYDEPRRKKRCNYATREIENKKVLKCDHCDFKTNYNRSLRNHKLNCIKSQENILSDYFNRAIDENVNYHSLSLTEMINLICNQDKSLDRNTSDETTTEVLKCLECTFETGNQKLFNFHSQIHVEGNKCTECKFESKDADTFKDHLISHFKCANIKERKVRDKKETHLSVKRFKCSDCSYETKYKESFDAHCAEHKNIKLFKCDYCDFESNYRKGLIRHSLNHCSKKAELNSNKNCVVDQSKNTNYCSLSLSEIMLLIFNKRKSLDENASVPSPAEPLKCSECSFETENPKCFEFHSQIHFEIQKCPECGYESTDTEAFKDHLITHLGQSRSGIESVPYSFRKRSEQFRKTLEDILSDEEENETSVNDKNHDSDSDFEDEMSNEEMDTRDNNYHRRKKKLRCHDCSYTTWRSENFVAHCLDHTKEKLFKCEFCDFKTNYRRTIKKHNLKCIKNQENSLGECFSIAIDENVNYQALTLSETINLICNKDKSLDINTIGLATKEVLRCLECPFETGNSKIFNLHSQIHLEVKKCTECNFESKDTETFKDHLIGHFKHKNIKEQKMFKCSDCSYETKYKGSYDAHCAEHKNIKLFKCDDCDFESNYRKCLIRHSLNHCSKKAELNSNKNCVVDQSKNTEFSSLSLSEIIVLIYNKRKSLDENASAPSPTERLKCQECSFETENSKYLEVHSQIHSETQKCPECGYESTDTETFKDHLIKNHLDQPTSESESAPSSLRKRSKRFNKTLVHILSDKEQNEISVNKNQDSNFEDEISNEEMDTRDNKYPRRNKKYRCHDCSYTTCKSEDLVAHCLDHADKKIFKCEHCDFKTNYTRSLRNHNLKCLKNHENSLSDCFNRAIDENVNYHSLSLTEMINLICNQDKSLDRNTSDETTTEVLKCLECTFETRNQKIFNLHSQIHVEIKKCTECNFESKDADTFKDHLISHFKCDNIKERKVRDKKKTHLSVKRFKCSDCSYKTKYKESYDAHCAEHKNIKLFKCDYCDFESNYRTCLIRHSLYRCSKKTELNSNKNCVVDQSKNTEFSSLSLSEIIVLIYNKSKSLGEKASAPSPTERLKCQECSFETENPKYFEFHSQIHSDIQKCPECGYESTDTESFKDHLIKNHLDQPTSESESAPSSLRKRSKRFNKTLVDISDEEQSEMPLNHKDKDSDFEDEISNKEVDTMDNNYLRGKKKYRCHDCSYTTCKSEDLVAHCLDHADKKIFKCEHCDFKTNYTRSLRNHNLKCLKNHENSLSDCFNRAIDENVNYHSLSLTEMINLICNQDKSLDRNTSDETTTEVLKCLECTFETGNQKIFNFHSQIHVEVKKCTECNFESKDTATFKDHLIAHLGQSRSEIESVPYSFKSNKTFKEYISYEEHSEMKMKGEYACDVCDFKTEFYPKFVSHLLLHNKDKTDRGYISTNFDNLKVYTFSDIISMICNDENEVNQDINLNSETKLHKCSQCSFECTDEVQLSEHLSSHSIEKKFICSQCSFEGSNQSDLDSHLQTHSTFKCSKCSYECSDISVLNLHSCEPNSDKVFKCLRCNFETKKEKHFTLHSQIHAKLRKCTECDFSHLRPNKFHHHLMTHLPIKLYSCTECGYKTNYINKLKLHLLNHTGMKVFQCSKCDYKTNQKGNLRNHIENHLEVKSFRCSECNYSTRSSRSLKLHILDHSQKKLFLCSECNYGCNDKTRMSRHVLQHSREKLYKCSRCEFETNFMKNLKDHEARRHGGSFSYACSHCEFKCYKHSSLKAHSIIHSNTKLLKCPECNYQCNANLKLHMINMHSKTKMYKCSQCKYEGNHRSNFLTHIRTHSNERKYSCTECNFACNRKDNLKVHMATHLKEKLSCAECSYKCSNKQQLKRHILSH